MTISINMDIPHKITEIRPISEGIEETDKDFNANAICCPVCGFDYSHQAGEITILSSDNYRAWAGRGEVIVIPFEGECGHKWKLCIGYHKGQNYIFNEVEEA